MTCYVYHVCIQLRRSTTKTGRHDIAEINQINQIKSNYKFPTNSHLIHVKLIFLNITKQTLTCKTLLTMCKLLSIKEYLLLLKIPLYSLTSDI
jgi:hypothetical protein